MKKTLGKIMAFVICLAMLFAFVPLQALASEAEVQAAAGGVLCVKAYWENVTIPDLDVKNATAIAMGSGFLIGTVTYSDNSVHSVVITCAHVVNDRISYNLGKADYVTVVAINDIEIGATVATVSDDCDFAILYLDQEIQSKKTLSLRTDELSPTDRAFALGFPADTIWYKSDVDYTATSVEITEGSISSLAQAIPSHALVRGSKRNVDVYLHTATISSGSSGGPLVDVNGNVVGVNFESIGTTSSAIRIREICEALDILGVSYTKADGAAATEVPTQEPTAEPAAEVTQAPTDVPPTEVPPTAVPPTVEPTNAPGAPALVEDNNNTGNGPQLLTLMLIIIGILVAIGVVILIIVLAVRAGKKNKKQAAAPQQPNYPPQQPNYPPQQGAGWSQPSSVGETSVLTGDAGATTVLSGGGSSAYLERTKTMEKVYINKNMFRIGKDRSHSDYTVSDNPAVSRSHATIAIKGGEYFIIDNKTTNHTYVNEKVIPSNIEMPIVHGDKIRLADEEFTFKMY